MSDFDLPDDYCVFLQRTNGGEGYLKQHFVILWRLEELLKFNEAYHTREYAPGLFLFGSNGGGEAFAFDRRTHSCVVNIPFVGMDLSLVELVYLSFSELLEGEHSFQALADLANSGQTGMEILEITPVILGGSPNDPASKILVNREKHIQAVSYWNKVIQDLRKRNQPRY